MKEREAIEFIKNKIQIDVRFCTDEDIENTKTALNIAINALEKQVPKRPIEDGYYDEPAVCPNCGGNVINQCDNDYQFQCCHYCGQRLDWSDHPTETGGGE